MASKLWTKPKRGGLTTYPDLFEDVSLKLQLEFAGWDQKLCNSEWQHRFLSDQYAPVKCNETAMRLGNTGNIHFERCEWRKAMEMYNRAMCFIENDSSAGVSLAKRGFCFANMKMYDAGNVDIDLAMAHKLAPEMVMEVRRNNEIFNERLQPHVAEVPKLSFDCDDHYTAMANVVELKTDADNRPYIAAKVDIDVGKTVLLEESFVSISNRYDRTCCATCLNEIRNFLPCRHCTDAVFCGVNCFQQNRIHQLTCGDKFHRMPTPVQFVIQSILKAISIFPTIEFLMQFVELHINSPSAAAAAAQCKVPLDAKLRDYGLFLKLDTQNSLSMVTAYQAYTTLLTMDLIVQRFKTRSKQRFLMHLVCHHVMV